MLSIDITPITTRLDKIIELLTTIITPIQTPIQTPLQTSIQEEPLQTSIQEEQPIQTSIQEEPLQTSIQEEPLQEHTNLITFENEEEEDVNKEQHPQTSSNITHQQQQQYNWATCVYNPNFEVEKTGYHFIRHKETHELMTISYDKELYPIPHFENVIFDDNNYPKKMAYIIALNFLPNPDNYKYLSYKDGSIYNFKVSNLIWSETYEHQHIIPMEEHIVMDPSFEPIQHLGNYTFYEHPVIKYKGQYYQTIERKKGSCYRLCYIENNEAIVITDDDVKIGIPLS
jgi:hypothetical protein